MNKNLTLAAALAAGLMGFAVQANAQGADPPITPSPTITSGNITFNNFTCSVVSGNGLTCGQIGVTSHTSVNPPDPTNGDYGIRIQGAFNSSPFTEDVAITYDATIAGGLFHDASMYFNGTVLSSVAEHIFNVANGDLIGTVFVNQSQLNSTPTDDVILSENATQIRVVKDIGLLNNGLTPGTISIIDQQFSQVPEPASLALLGSGLLGLGLIRRWRRKT